MWMYHSFILTMPDRSILVALVYMYTLEISGCDVNQVQHNALHITFECLCRRYHNSLLSAIITIAISL